MHGADQGLLHALADAVQRLLLAHAADVADVRDDPGAAVTWRIQRPGVEESTHLLDRIQALGGAGPDTG